jgi:hypothetical protein
VIGVPTRQLSPSELHQANHLLEEIRRRLSGMAGEDESLHFAYRRKIAKELTYDERSKPMVRRALKKKKYDEQEGICPICNRLLPDRYAILDRIIAISGYTSENTRLIHQHCDQQVQSERKYS